VKRGATITDLASEFLARMSGSAGEGSSVVVVPTPTDPAGIRRCARDLKTWSVAKKHTNEERGGSRIPGVRRPGARRGHLPARSKIFRAAFSFFDLRSMSVHNFGTCASKSASPWQNPIFPASKHVFFSEFAIALRFFKRKSRSCAQT